VRHCLQGVAVGFIHAGENLRRHPDPLVEELDRFGSAAILDQLPEIGDKRSIILIRAQRRLEHGEFRHR
jgi:hypothetical protein